MAIEATGESRAKASLPPWQLAAQVATRRLQQTWRWLPGDRSLPAPTFEARHRWLTRLLWVHAAGLPLYGIGRGYPISHVLLEGGILTVLAAGAAFGSRTGRWREAFAALGLITASAVFVHFSGGLIEAHFHFFVVVLILGMYEDWLPFLIALGYVLVHHGLMGQFAPELVYNHPDALAHPWKWAAIHSAFVAAAAMGAVVAWRSNEVARAEVAAAAAEASMSHEANQLKSRFVATASHELRTPLTSIAGFTTTLIHRWGDTNEQDKLEMLGIIDAQSGRLRNLIEDLLVLSTVESGKVAVRGQTFDAGTATEQVIRELGLNSAVVVDASPGCLVHADEAHFARIVVNLVSNARKYGAAPIRVLVKPAKQWVDVIVSDEGPGVPLAFQPHLFESFAHGTAYKTDEGTGLGLSIVRGLAQANGGEVGYEPNTPRGARFRVRLPRAHSAAER